MSPATYKKITYHSNKNSDVVFTVCNDIVEELLQGTISKLDDDNACLTNDELHSKAVWSDENNDEYFLIIEKLQERGEL